MELKSLRFLVLSFGLALAAVPVRPASAPLTPPDEPILAEARALVEAMRRNERGPYARLRWYCNDGTVHPPSPYPCEARGGGRQHAEYSPERQRLAGIGWSVGTIYAALDFDQLFDAGRRNDRMRQIPLESYLVAVDDGWVLRRARSYRGRVQVEDEEAAGRGLLLEALARGEWVEENYLLVRELARVVPHHGGSDRTRTVRTLSQEIAEEDSSFERLRIRIHTAPGPGDIESVAGWLSQARARSVPADRIAKAERLRQELDALYGPGAAWRQEARRALAGTAAWGALGTAVGLSESAPAAERLAAFTSALASTRALVAGPGGDRPGAVALALLDLSLALEREVTKAAFERLARTDLTRAELLGLARGLQSAAYGAGLLSAGERQALEGAVAPLAGAGEAAAADYVQAVRALRRIGPWALATVRYTFGEPLVRYAALTPEAGRFPDEVLRGSALLPLAEVTTRLSGDSDRLSGISHRLFGATFGGMLGLNPGIAVGPLRVFGADWSGGGVERHEIVVLPRTVAELAPVAGILSLGEGNLLSHIQILARNLGIPNATLAPSVARTLEDRDGARVLLAVGTDGSIVLEAESELPPAARELLASPSPAAAGGGNRIAAPAPDLSVRRLLPLEELEAGLSGRVVGPKAANLGELARLFPGRVEQAVAIPFGIFHGHLSGGGESPRARLERVFAAHRAGEVPDDELLDEVARIRAAIAGTRLSDELREDLRREMARRFGPPGSYGVFIRSDTNVEDLPGFTGAGLNQTLPHVTDFDRIAAGIATVWSSPLAPRALAWRSMILERPEDVYASVLLMKSVPADKSGVLITTDLVDRRPGLTVATAWGVGGAVDGEAAETLVLRPDGGETLVGEAKAPYRRRLEPAGGVAWVPAPAGPVLTAEEKRALRQLAAEVAAKRRPASGRDGRPLPWDIEFGFVGGELALFQIRPLVERGQQRADALIDTLVSARPTLPAAVALDEPAAAAHP